MNLNHDPDRHLLDQIDKLLDDHQPTGTEALDDLASTHPTPRPAFQKALEERLLARHDAIKEGEAPMVSSNVYMPVAAPRRNWLPLTLLAALLVVAIAGTMLINGRGKSPKINEMALAQASTTPTSSPLVRIVVAAQNLPDGYTFPVSEADINSVVHYVAWPAESVPPNALREDMQGLQKSLGKTLLTDVLLNQPITTDILTDGKFSTPSADMLQPHPYNSLADRVAVDLPLAALTSDSVQPQVGDSFDIVALLPYKGTSVTDGVQATYMPPNSAIVISNDIVQGGTLLHMGSWASGSQSNATPTPDEHPTTMTVAVPKENAGLLTWLASQPVTFRLTRPVGRLDLLPADADTITIPLKNIANVSEPLQSGDLVDVYSICAFVPDVVGMNNTVVSAKADCSQATETEEITASTIIDANVTSGTSDNHYQAVMLSVPLSSGSRFRKLIDGNMHFKLVKSSPTQAATPMPTATVAPATASQSVAAPTTAPTVSNATLSAFLQPGRVAISIPMSQLTSDSLVPGAGGETDIVALFNFKATNPNLDTMSTTPMPDGSRTVEMALIHEAVVIFHSPTSNLPDAAATITFSVSSDDSKLLAWLGEQSQVNFRLQKPLAAPLDSGVLFMPIENITADEHIQAGDTVDILSICAFVPDALGSSNAQPKTDCSQTTSTKRAVNVLVTSGEIVLNGATSIRTNAYMTLAVPQTTLPMFAQMIDARMHFKLVKSSSADQTQPTATLTPTPVPQPTLASSKVTVDIPLVNITFIPLNDLQAAEGVGYNKGTYVSIISTVLVLGTDNGDTSTPEATQAVMPIGTEVPGQLTRVAVQAALITNVTSDTLTVAVKPDEAAAIQRLLDAKLPLKIRPVPPLMPTTTPPSNTMTLTLDSISRWSTDKLEVGDRVDVVIGLVEGEGKSLNLSFQSYGEYYWIDPFSDGAFNALTYIPDPSSKPKGGFFMRGLLRNATIIAIEQQTDAKSGRIKYIKLTLDLSTNTTASEALKGYIGAGLPYLVIKHD